MATGPTTSSIAAGRYALESLYGPTPDAVSAATFKAWPVGAQVAFVRAFAEGTPPAVLVGSPAGGQVVATLAAGGGDVDVVAVPNDFNALPSQLDVDAFQGWARAAQLLYVRLNGSGTPTAVEIGPSGATLTATVLWNAAGAAVGLDLASSPGLTQRYGGLLDTAPADLTPVAFFALPPDEQYAYALERGTGSPPTVALAGAGADGIQIPLSDGGRAYAVTVPASTYPGFSTPLTGQAGVAARFDSWPREVQQAYVEARIAGGPDAYPKTVVVNGKFIAMIATAGAAVDVMYVPDRFTSQDLPSSAVFLGWPAAAQIAYARTHLLDLAEPSPLILPSEKGQGQSLAVSLVDGSGGIALASPSLPQTDTGDLDLDLFRLWAPADQVAYLQARGQGEPRILVVGNGTAVLSLTADGQVGLEAVPDAVRKTPAQITPSGFLDLSPTMRRVYLDRWRDGGTQSLTIASQGAQITATLDADGRVSVSNDALRLGSSAAMALGLATPTANQYGGAGGTDPEPNQGNAQTLFPTLTGAAGTTAAGATYTVDKPADVAAYFVPGAAAPTPEVFGSWHSAIQLEYIRTFGTPASVSYVEPQAAAAAAAADAAATAADQAAKAVTDARAALDQAKNAYDYAVLHKYDAGVDIPEATRNYNAAQVKYAAAVAAGTKAKAAADEAEAAAAAFPVRGGRMTATTWVLTLGAGEAATTAFVSAAGTKVYTVESLQKTDIGRLTAADQAILANQPAFQALAAGRGLSTDRAAANALVEGLANAIRYPSDEPSSPYYVKGGDSGMPLADKQIFLDELAILTAKIAGGSVFSPKDINDQVAEIRTRFERLNCFAVALPRVFADTKQVSGFQIGVSGEGPKAAASLATSSSSVQDANQIQVREIPGGQQVTLATYLGSVPGDLTGNTYTKSFAPPKQLQFGINSGLSGVKWSEATTSVESITIPVKTVAPPTVSLNDAALKQAYDTFRAQEKQLLDLATNRQALAGGTGPANTQNLDVPNLVYLFQLYSNLAGEAKIRADTEEINQINEFVKFYGVMQNLINQTTKQFDPKNADEKRSIVNPNSDEQRAIAFFSQDDSRSPIELLKKLTHPTQDFSGEQKSNYWQTYGTQLSDRVSLINQESQIRMNDINSQTKAKDRNFDLANNALSKMNEIVQKIAGAS